MPPKSTDWAYHATHRDNLPSIKEQGLIPEVNWGLIEQGEESPEMIYFGYSESSVQDYGDGETILRFPWPDDWEDATYQYGTEGSVTYKRVPPEVIQLKVGSRWVPLVRATFAGLLRGGLR